MVCEIALDKSNMRSINKKAICAFVVVAILILMLPIANATGEDIIRGQVAVIESGVPTVIFSIMNSGNAAFATIDPNSSEIASGIKVIFEVIGGCSGFFLFIFFLMHIFQNIERGMDDKEAIIRGLRELALMGIVVANTTKIIALISKFGMALIEQVTSGIVSEAMGDALETGGMYETLCNSHGYNPDGLTIFQFISMWMMLVGPQLASGIMSIIASFMCYSIILELGIRLAFSPFAVVDIYGEGLRSPGARYLKKYLATYIKIIIAMLVGALVAEVQLNLINASFTLTGFESIGTWSASVVTGFAGIGLISKGGEYANDIVGV